jgi:MFS family permease
VTIARNREERVAVTSTAALSRTDARPTAVRPRPAPEQDRPATFRDVFSVREFRALWGSQILSELGDRLTLVALTLLIYARTGSPLLSALTYAAGSLPWVLGSLVFSGLGDRMPRRQVMVACDVIRAVMVTAMLVPGIPVGALVGLLYLTTTAQAPFEAARSAVLPDVLAGERYALAATVMQTTFRVALVGGAAVGGAAIAFVGARPALALDAATFVASALLIRWGTRVRPAPARSDQHPVRQLTDGFRLLLGDKTIRTVMMLGWLIALYSIPEGIAAPYVARLGGGPLAAGLIVASGQAGAVLVAPVFARKVGPRARRRWMGPMAACTCATLLLTVFRPGLAVSMAIFALSGTFAIYQIAANTAFVRCVPDERRSQAFGLASMGTVASQGVALLLAGAAAEFLTPSTVIAISGALGTLAALALTVRWRQLSPALDRHPAPACPASLHVPAWLHVPAPAGAFAHFPVSASVGVPAPVGVLAHFPAPPSVGVPAPTPTRGRPAWSATAGHAFPTPPSSPAVPPSSPAVPPSSPAVPLASPAARPPSPAVPPASPAARPPSPAVPPARPKRPGLHPSRPAHQLPASRCRPQPSHRPPHPREVPVAHTQHRRIGITASGPRDRTVRHLFAARPKGTPASATAR